MCLTVPFKAICNFGEVQFYFILEIVQYMRQFQYHTLYGYRLALLIQEHPTKPFVGAFAFIPYVSTFGSQCCIEAWWRLRSLAGMPSLPYRIKWGSLGITLALWKWHKQRLIKKYTSTSINFVSLETLVNEFVSKNKGATKK